MTTNLDNEIFPLTKYKKYTYKQVLETKDERYFKYLISNFKILYEDIFSFYEYMRSKNKYTEEINKLLNIKILLDTETSGFANSDYVLQLAYVLFNNNQILKSYNQIIKIDPKFKITNAYIHHINNDKCARLGIPLNESLDRFNSDLKYCNSIIGHNVNFDIRMLRNEFNRQKYDCSLLESIKKEDTMSLSIKKYGKKNKLGELYKLEFNEEMENAHNAFYDVMATYKIYKKICIT
jgi:DNA polymerase III epsilon subunit-like protein